MRSMIVHGFAAVSFGAVLAIGISTHAQAAAPANYSQACKELVASVVASNGFVEKAALCPSCGAPHRSPDSPPPWLLNREDDGPPSVAGHKRTPSVSSGCRREPPATPTAAMLDLIDNALLASTEAPGVKCATYFCQKLGWRTAREFCAYEEAGFAKRAGSHEAHL